MHTHFGTCADILECLIRKNIVYDKLAYLLIFTQKNSEQNNRTCIHRAHGKQRAVNKVKDVWQYLLILNKRMN